ncbi:MAG: LD-carboxypeptidase [Candidatus Dadabacteria bacterium]|nr:MAG: LD-carboxypeptidase [Candidatus Dadabacteria bacterium]
MRKPAAIHEGDTVGLVAPSGRFDPQRLARGVEILESWGLRVRCYEGAKPVRYLAAADRIRAEWLEAAFVDPEIAAILAVRGGFGASRLHTFFDPAVAAANPKAFVGFSDVSLLLNRLVQEAGLVCYHGPMVAADLPRLSEAARERFRRFLFGEPGWWNGQGREVWRSGTAEGRLVGGCLSVLVTTLGTPYEIDTRGAVLFLEDVAEKPYRIDRMLSHLRHAGKFEEVAAVVFGPMLDCDGGGGTRLLREIALEVLDGFRFPIVFGLDAGHGSDNVVLPLGCRVRVDGEAARLELLEDPFA